MKNKILNFYACIFWKSFFQSKYQFQEKKVEQMISKLKLLYTDKVKLLEKLDIKKVKKSKTLFILGSGASINQLSKEQWEKIKKSDSIALNFWMMHQFVPTYYAAEMPSNQQQKEVFFQNLKARDEAYKNTIMIIKNSHSGWIDLDKLPDNIIKNTYISRMIEIPFRKENQIKKSLQKLTIILNENARKNVPLKELYYSRASIVWALFFGYMCGYKHIVFCGVDLNHTGYFFEESCSKVCQTTTPPINLQQGKVHKTLDKKYGEVTVDQIIYQVNRYLLKPKNITLHVINKNSALYPRIPLYSTEEYDD